MAGDAEVDSVVVFVARTSNSFPGFTTVTVPSRAVK
jgi:hypothetical protein